MIHVAIIGTGAISDSHIEAFLTFPERCKIVALVDQNPSKAQEKIDKYSLEAEIFTTSADLLNMPQLELASICLPPSLHCSVAVELLEAGVHVLCEKPLAPSLEECDAMLAAAEKSGALLSTVAQNRFKPEVAKVNALCESGLLGSMKSALVTSLWWRGENYYNLAWRGKWESEGGGCTLIHGIHHIDLMLWLMGKVKSVQALAANQAHTNSEVEDISMALLHFENGAVGTFVSSLLHHGEEQRLMLDAEHASIELPLNISANTQLENGFPQNNDALVTKLQDLADSVEINYTGHTAQIEDMLQAIETNGKPSITGEDGRRAIEFIMALYQSAFTGTSVQLPLTQIDPFYSQEGCVSEAPRFYQKTISIDSFSDNTIQVGGTL